MNSIFLNHRMFIFLNLFMFAILFSSFSQEPSISKESGKGTWSETNLGPQIHYVQIQSACFGKDVSGRDVFYITLADGPAKLTILDVETREVGKVLDIPGAKGGHACTFTKNGNLYIGSSNNGHLYRYIPGADQLEDLGIPFEETTFLFCLVENKEGNLYGGTYPEGKMYEYNIRDKTFKSFGVMVEGEDYVRAIAFDPETNLIYGGIGSHAALMRFNPLTGEKIDILPKDYNKNQFVSGVELIQGKIFVKLKPDEISLVLDKKTGEIDYVLPEYGGDEFSSKSPLENVIYYTGRNMLKEYNLDLKKHTDLDFDLKGSAVAFGYHYDKNGVPYLVALSSGRRILYYNLKTKESKVHYVEIPKQPVNLHNVFKGPDGKIYSSAYILRELGVYDPKTGASLSYHGVGQSEGITNIGFKIYFGVYPHAKIYVYDTMKKWDMREGNPREIFRLEEHGQDRPFSMLGVEKENKVFIGTVPTYGELGGALSVYDPATEKLEVHRNIIPNQSIITLCYSEGLVFGGSAIMGGLGIKPTKKEAKLFIWDVKKEEKVFETVPVPGKIGVMYLTKAPDGKIWGWAGGDLFIFDPKSRKFVYSNHFFDPGFTYENIHAWRNGGMEYGGDGYFYGLLKDKFFRIHSETKKMEILHEGEMIRLARDDSGDFYTIKGHNLVKISPPEKISGSIQKPSFKPQR